MKEWKLNIENFFEKHNAKIQIIIFIVSLVIGAYFNICQENQLGIMIGLLFLISGELISLNLKDSITQRKLNSWGVKYEIERGALFRVHDFDLTKFFNNTEKQFFISGMALNGFFHENKSVIERFLKEGKEVFVLISDPSSVDENTRLYNGISLDEKELAKNKNKILHKQLSTLNYIEEIENIFLYIEKGKFNLKTLSSAMSTSFVAYDIFEKDVLSHNNEKDGKELKASFYQYKCTEPKEEPNVIVDSLHSRDWYLIFKRTIQMQWEDAEIISNKNEFNDLRKKIDSLMSENRIYIDSNDHQ